MKPKKFVLMILLLLVLIPVCVNGILITSLLLKTDTAVHGFLLPYYFATGNESEAIKDYMAKRGWKFEDQWGSLYMFKKNGVSKKIMSTDIKTIFP